MNYSSHYIVLVSLVVATWGHNTTFLSDDLGHSVSVMYVRDRTVDRVTTQCLLDIYSSYKYNSRYSTFSRSDVPCILHCVLSQFGIMNYKGLIDVSRYDKLVRRLHNYDPRIIISDVGQKCAEDVKRSKIGVCEKALKFVWCTKLFAVRYQDGY